MLECGFCGSKLSRRSWHAGTEYQKTVWQCIVNTKQGKKFCPDAKGIAEETIERAFLESYRLLCHNNKDVIDELLKRIEETLCTDNSTKEYRRIEKELAALEHKRKKLVDMRLDDIIDRETYEEKYADLTDSLSRLSEDREKIKDIASRELNIKQRIEDFRRVLKQNEIIDKFDRFIFESIIDKVIRGKGESSSDKLCSNTSAEVDNSYSFHSHDKGRDKRFVTKELNFVSADKGGNYANYKKVRRK